MSCKCMSCDKQFCSKQGLSYHISHNVCQNKYTCSQCQSFFSSKQMLDYHVSHNVCDKKIKIKLSLKIKKNDDIIQLKTLSQHELYEEVLRLKGENKSLKENPMTINNNNNQINIIVPPAFLKMDNYDQVVHDLPNLLHNALSKHPANFISYLIKETNCNPQLPLYNSVKITNIKSQFAQISDGKKYVYASKKKIIADLIENKKNLLQEYVDNNGDKYGEKILARYERYSELLADNKETQKDLETDIICMLLNISDLIGSDEWSKNLLENLKKEEMISDNNI